MWEGRDTTRPPSTSSYDATGARPPSLNGNLGPKATEFLYFLMRTFNFLEILNVVDFGMGCSSVNLPSNLNYDNPSKGL